ncbi:tetratricopeptide repeat protein, partial [bacterium]|nr:tetratricopeptide repeat protein [bacterium]
MFVFRIIFYSFVLMAALFLPSHIARAADCRHNICGSIRAGALDIVSGFFSNTFKPKSPGLSFKDTPLMRQNARAFTHYLMGVVFENRQEYQSALSEFKLALREAPGNEYLNFKIASSYLDLKEYDAARRQIDKILKLNPGNLNARFLLAALYFEKDQMGPASGEYEAIINQDPGNVLALVSLADIYIMEKKLQAALEVYKRLIQEDEFSPYLYFNIGLLHFKLDDPRAAEESFLKAITLRPDYTAPIAALGVMAELDKNYDKAVGYFKQAVSVQPDDYRLQARLAKVFDSAGLLENARLEYERILLDCPDCVQALIGIAEIYIQVKEYDKALIALDSLADDEQYGYYAVYLTGIINFVQDKY